MSSGSVWEKGQREMNVTGKEYDWGALKKLLGELTITLQELYMSM